MANSLRAAPEPSNENVILRCLSTDKSALPQTYELYVHFYKPLPVACDKKGWPMIVVQF